MTQIDFFKTKLLKHITAIQKDIVYELTCNSQNGTNWSDLELEFHLRLKEVLKSFLILSSCHYNRFGIFFD